jgi:hypothetical protein
MYIRTYLFKTLIYISRLGRRSGSKFAPLPSAGIKPQVGPGEGYYGRMTSAGFSDVLSPRYDINTEEIYIANYLPSLGEVM